MATVQSIDGIVTNLISQTEDPNNLRRVSKGKLKIQRVSRIGNASSEALETIPAIAEVEVDLSHVTGEDINEEDLMRELDVTRIERTFSIDEELNLELGGGLFDDIDIDSPPPAETNPPPDPPVIEENVLPEATATIDQSEEIKIQLTPDAMAHVEEEIARRQQEADTLAQSALVSTSRGLQPISKLTPSELEEHHAEIVEKKLVTESQYTELLQITEETAKLKSRLAAEKEMKQNIGAAKQNISAAKEMFATMSKEAESQRAAAAAAAAAQPTVERPSASTRQVKIDPIVLDDHEKVIRDISTEPTGFNVDSFVTYMTSRMGQVLMEHLHGFFGTLQPNEEGIITLEKFKELVEGADLVYAFKHWLEESRSEEKESDHTEISGSKIVSGFAGLESQPSRKIVTVDEEHKEKVLQAKLVTDSKYAAALQAQNKELNRVNAQDEIGGTSLVKNSIWLQNSATETQTTTPRRKRKKKKASVGTAEPSPSPDAQG